MMFNRIFGRSDKLASASTMTAASLSLISHNRSNHHGGALLHCSDRASSNAWRRTQMEAVDRPPVGGLSSEDLIHPDLHRLAESDEHYFGAPPAAGSLRAQWVGPLRLYCARIAKLRWNR